MNAQLTRSHIDKILSYLRTSHQFINCHMVEFITEKLWEKFIPMAIQDEVGSSGDIEAATKLFLASGQPSRFPSLHNFISNSEGYHLEKLEGVLLSQAELLSSIGVDANVQDDSVNIREFMNEKKNHEVGMKFPKYYILNQQIRCRAGRNRFEISVYVNIELIRFGNR